MAEIGANLREARMRQRIDITDMEMRTKIRAKYLRALENEEWDLLPGPTYVRSFLRTYADALGLDSRLLVEEYKLRHDPLETGELHPIRRPTQRERDRRRQRDPRGIPPAALLGLVLAAIVGALWLVGRDGGDGGDETPPPAGVSTTRTEARSDTSGEDSGAQDEQRDGKSEDDKQPSAASRVVRLQVVADAVPVTFCLADINGEILADNEALRAGETSKTYRSKRFRLILSSSQASLKINGTTRAIEAPAGAVGYTITKNGRSDLPASKRPRCG